MTNNSDRTPVVQPIQKGSANPSSASSGGNDNNINPSPVVDEGPSDSSIPSSQASTAARPGTQDALRGQGNSATKEGVSREDLAPVPSEQRKDVQEEDAKGGKEVESAGGHSDFVQTGAKGNEPAPGKPKTDGSAGDNLVEAGTTMAGDASAGGGTEPSKPSPSSQSKNAKL